MHLDDWDQEGQRVKGSTMEEVDVFSRSSGSSSGAGNDFCLDLGMVGYRGTCSAILSQRKKDLLYVGNAANAQPPIHHWWATQSQEPLITHGELMSANGPNSSKVHESPDVGWDDCQYRVIEVILDMF